MKPMFFFVFFLYVLLCHKTYALCILPKPYIVMKRALFKPAYGIMLLIAFANSESSVAPVHPHRLTRVLAHMYSIELDKGLDQESDI